MHAAAFFRKIGGLRRLGIGTGVGGGFWVWRGRGCVRRSQVAREEGADLVVALAVDLALVLAGDVGEEGAARELGVIEEALEVLGRHFMCLDHETADTAQARAQTQMHGYTYRLRHRQRDRDREREKGAR